MVSERESITAKICAFARAWHSTYSRDRIYDDYLAFDFMGKEEYENIYDMISDGLVGSERLEKEEAEKAIVKYFAPIPLSRLHFNENKLIDFAAENGKIQYVICGAGEDTFAFRNDNEDIEIFEVDHPDTQRFKLDRIKGQMYIMFLWISRRKVWQRNYLKQALIRTRKPSSASSEYRIISHLMYLPRHSDRWQN